MRAGLSTIQQTLTAEAAGVLNNSIAEASRRNHGQTTPLHVAATLLSSPTGYLRQACIRSHPNSSHPLQCRALELCFSVALERLPTAQNMAAPGAEPPISNALMAALKRAQANQRRGCPEQQQQPLLAVKVELEQLIISILDDPSVSRVMREASFSSPAVKATIEQSLSSSNAQAHQHSPIGAGNVSFGASFVGNGPRMISNAVQLSSTPAQIPSPLVPLASRNMYPTLLQRGGTGQASTLKDEEVKKVLEIMVRNNKRNPILVGDCELEPAVKELLRKIESKELGNDGILKNAQILSLDKEFLSDKKQIPARIKELEGVIESKISNGGVILDLGDLKWLVEQPVNLGVVQQPQVISEMGRAALVEMEKLSARFRGSTAAEGDSLWLIGTATCETYLRCQVYHPSMENDLDLQAVPIASRPPPPGLFPRLGMERILCNPMESLNPLKVAPSPLPMLTRHLPENLDPSRGHTFCPQCTDNYKTELAKLEAIEESFSESKQEGTKTSLPPWLRNTEIGKGQGVVSKQKIQELQKKWKDACLHLHPKFHQSNLPERPNFPALSMSSLFNQPLLSRPSSQPKLHAKPLGETLRLNTNQITSLQPAEHPASPVHTDLVLGRKGPDNDIEKDDENPAKDFLSCISSEPNIKVLDKFSTALDTDTYKKLLKGLMENAWWQAEAASSVASAVTRCQSGNGKRRGEGLRGDIWLLFTGPDRVGKKKMAAVLANQTCGANPITFCLGKRRDDVELDLTSRGRTSIDRIADAIRRNPVCVIMLEDIDEADVLLRASIKRAIERGRLTDSHGRELSLGNTIFILTGDWSTTDPESLTSGCFVDASKLATTACGNWQLGLVLRDKSSKRRASWLQDEDRQLKPRKEMGSVLSLDLNLAATFDQKDDKTDISYNSSDVTINQEEEIALGNAHFSVSSVPYELASNVDASIVFKPVDSAFVRQEIKKTISVKFSMVVGDKLPIEVEDVVVEKILGGVWHDPTTLESWVENVLTPSFDQLKPLLPSGDGSGSVVRLVIEPDSSENRRGGDWLPDSIIV